MSETITSVEFRNFKALRRFSVQLDRMNILVGPNNSGKSTILGAFRALATAIRRARARKAELVQGPNGPAHGHHIPSEALPISVENVHTDYSDEATMVRFRISNGNYLTLHFPADGGCHLIPEAGGKATWTPAQFRSAFPVSIGVVPVLGPVEHEEELLTEDTVQRSLGTHRASRHFRNYWWYNPAGFEIFAEAVRDSWPGMDIMPPERPDVFSKRLVMFCQESRIPRELFWAGFGFQVWCQLLTHLIRARAETLVVVDEPETYLHPDLQRNLLSFLRYLAPDCLLATHSTEIMGDAEPSEILVVDKTRRSARRLRDTTGLQEALEVVGSVQNVTLTRLARNKRVAFFEGPDDFKLIRAFAQRLGLAQLAIGSGLTALDGGGFSSWDRIKASAWGIAKTLGQQLKIAAVLDRDFWSAEEIAAIEAELGAAIDVVHIHSRKELENYLLVPRVLQRAIDKGLAERADRQALSDTVVMDVSALLKKITDPMCNTLRAQYIEKRASYLARSGRDRSEITAETLDWFDTKWRLLDSRLEIVGGKAVLATLRDEVQRQHGVTLTTHRIVAEFRREDIPEDLHHLLAALDQFRAR